MDVRFPVAFTDPSAPSRFSTATEFWLKRRLARRIFSGCFNDGRVSPAFDSAPEPE